MVKLRANGIQYSVLWINKNLEKLAIRRIYLAILSTLYIKIGVQVRLSQMNVCVYKWRYLRGERNKIETEENREWLEEATKRHNKRSCNWEWEREQSTIDIHILERVRVSVSVCACIFKPNSKQNHIQV